MPLGCVHRSIAATERTPGILHTKQYPWFMSGRIMVNRVTMGRINLISVASIPIEAGRNLRPLKNGGGGDHIMHFSTRKLQGAPKKVIP